MDVTPAVHGESVGGKEPAGLLPRSPVRADGRGWNPPCRTGADLG